MTTTMRQRRPAHADAASTPASRISIGLEKIGLALRHSAWREGSRRGLTPTQGHILAMLDATNTKAPTVADLARRLGVSAPTVSDAVAALHSKRLLRKTRHATDARVITLGLTARGRTEARHASTWSDFLARAAQELSHGEQTVFLRSVVKMIRALQERGEIPVSRMCVTCRYFRPNAHHDAERPHHCAFVDAPFGDASLRIDCPDHVPAPRDQAAKAWSLFVLH